MLDSIIPLLSGFAQGRAQKAEMAERRDMMNLQKEMVKLQKLKAQGEIDAQTQRQVLINSLLPMFTGAGQAPPGLAQPGPGAAQMGETFPPEMQGAMPQGAGQQMGGLTDAIAQGQLQMTPEMAFMLEMAGVKGGNDLFRNQSQQREVRWEDLGDRKEAFDRYGNPTGQAALPKATPSILMDQVGPEGTSKVPFNPYTNQVVGEPMFSSPPQHIPIAGQTAAGEPTTSFVNPQFPPQDSLITGPPPPLSGRYAQALSGAKSAQTDLHRLREMFFKDDGTIDMDLVRMMSSPIHAGRSKEAYDTFLRVLDSLDETKNPRALDNLKQQFMPNWRDSREGIEAKFSNLEAVLTEWIESGDPTYRGRQDAKRQPPKDYPDAQWSDREKGWVIEVDGQWFKVVE
jgi:hypothetical protein